MSSTNGNGSFVYGFSYNNIYLQSGDFTHVSNNSSATLRPGYNWVDYVPATSATTVSLVIPASGAEQKYVIGSVRGGFDLGAGAGPSLTLSGAQGAGITINGATSVSFVSGVNNSTLGYPVVTLWQVSGVKWQAINSFS